MPHALPICLALALTPLLGRSSTAGVPADDPLQTPDAPAESAYPEMPAGSPPELAVEDANAKTEADMRAYTDRILGSEVSFRMVPIPGGKFLMGSPEEERDHGEDEGPQYEVLIEPFWMGACEVTWDEYEVFMLRQDQKAEVPTEGAEAPTRAPQDSWADAVSRPTPPYVPMDFNMGVAGFPAISMTQFAAKQYTKWLTMKTGRFHRLASEAEWEYACRAGTTTAYCFGDSFKDLDDYAWYFENSDDGYHPVGKKRPNAWGLFDMHGNVCEWVLDGYLAGIYGERFVDQALSGEPLANPIQWPKREYPRVVRGGSWDDDAKELRSAARRRSRDSWKMMDPQLPKSIWYHTNAQTVGFRIVRPLVPPPQDQWAQFWEADVESVALIQARQRRGEK